MIDGDALSGIKAAEGRLAREQRSQEIEADMAALPEDDPLRLALEEQKRNIGDLGELPAGHPLLQGLAQSRRDYEMRRAREEGEQPPDEAIELRKAKKLEKAEERRKEREREEESRSVRRTAGKALNAKIDDATRAIDEVRKAMVELEGDLSTDQYTKARVMQLNRILLASRRGLEDCRISIVRV